MAPTKMVGVKTPPMAPEPEVAAVAKTLAIRMATTAVAGHGACRTLLTTS
jgi:hypothetical protein